MKTNTLCAAVAAGLLGLAGTSFAQNVAPRVGGGDSSGVLPSENCTSLTGAEKASCEERNARARSSTGASGAVVAPASGAAVVPATGASVGPGSGATQAPGNPVSAALPSERCEHLSGFEKEKCEELNASDRSSRGRPSTGGSRTATPTPGGR